MNPSRLSCPGRLELPNDLNVYCDQNLGHEGKHNGAINGKRYWWTALYARVQSLIPRGSRA